MVLMYCMYYKSIPKYIEIKNDDIKMKYIRFKQNATTSDGFTPSLANLSRHNKQLEKNLVLITLKI